MAQRSPISRPVVWLRGLWDGLRESLFFAPVLFVAMAVLLWRVMVSVDGLVAEESLPRVLVIGRENALSLLATIVTGTMAAASIVFSIVLIALQLAASQFSPRVVRDFIRDRFQQTVMGLEIGVVTYSLLILTEIPSAGRPGAVPHLSVTLATLLAVVAVVVLLAGVDHVASSLKVSSILRRIILETRQLIDRTFHGGEHHEPRQALFQAPMMVPSTAPVEAPPLGAEVLIAPEDGWVQQIGEEAILTALPEGTTLWLELAVGTYVSRGAAVGAIFPPPDGDSVQDRIWSGVEFGHQRTMQQDIGYGILRCEDIALIALSPSVNDLNTGQEAIAGLGSILSSLVGCDLSRVGAERDGKRIVTHPAPTFGEYVAAAFDQIRMLAAPHPHVLAHLIRTLGRVRAEAIRLGVPAAIPPLDQQVSAILRALAAGSITLESDRHVVIAAARGSGFDPSPGP